MLEIYKQYPIYLIYSMLYINVKLNYLISIVNVISTEFQIKCEIMCKKTLRDRLISEIKALVLNVTIMFLKMYFDEEIT